MKTQFLFTSIVFLFVTASAYEVEDETFKDAGKIGLSTKADSVIHFDDLQVTTR
jgi:hypothetical protein